MSRLTDLIEKAKAEDPQLGADLEREFRALSSRLPFGLNFERHQPEAVELPRRPVRRGDKVRVLPPREKRLGEISDCGKSSGSFRKPVLDWLNWKVSKQTGAHNAPR